MTPEKDKADDIFVKMLELIPDFMVREDSDAKDIAKNHALIAVDEIINSEPTYPSNVDWDDCGATHQYYYEAQREQAMSFWQGVRKEIQQL